MWDEVSGCEEEGGNIPDVRSECDTVPGQQCRVVPRQVCQPGCSTSQQCNQCDQFRAQGGFSSCQAQGGSCPNYFPQDPFIGGGYQGLQPDQQGGFNPGYTPGQSNGQVGWQFYTEFTLLCFT